MKRTAVALCAAVLVAIVAPVSVGHSTPARALDRSHSAQVSRYSLSEPSTGAAELLGDSLTLEKARALQLAQHAAELDHALHREKASRHAADVSNDSLSGVLGAHLADDSSMERHATFDLRQPPYSVHAEVSMPKASDSVYLALRIRLDTTNVDARVMCTSADANGLRAASVEAQTPRWLALRVRHVEQSPDVCPQGR